MKSKPQPTVGNALQEGTRTLRAHRCVGSDAQREAAALLCHALRCTPEALLLQSQCPVKAQVIAAYRALLRRRRNHEPLAHILGTALFFGRSFRVTRSTLIPRPATETLVSRVMADYQRTEKVFMLDIGTGSGCIASTLALELPQARVAASDLSPEALKTAKANARVHSARVAFRRGDGIMPFAGILRRQAQAHIVIVANLPYIPAGDWKKMSPDITRFEPRSALTAGKDGLDSYRSLVTQIASIHAAAASMRLYAEILPGQFRALRAFIRRAFPHADTTPVRNDQGKIIALSCLLHSS